MEVCAAGYASYYVTTLKPQLVSRMVVGLTVAEFKHLMLPLYGFSLANTTYIWI
jgi:hypothetical protein